MEKCHAKHKINFKSYYATYHSRNQQNSFKTFKILIASFGIDPAIELNRSQNLPGS